MHTYAKPFPLTMILIYSVHVTDLFLETSKHLLTTVLGEKLLRQQETISSITDHIETRLILKNSRGDTLKT